jgi:hypothetical protein
MVPDRPFYPWKALSNQTGGKNAGTNANPKDGRCEPLRLALLFLLILEATKALES